MRAGHLTVTEGETLFADKREVQKLLRTLAPEKREQIADRRAEWLKKKRDAAEKALSKLPEDVRAIIVSLAGLMED